MAYLQNGVCFDTLAAAKADFVSRIHGAEQRAEAVKTVSEMTTSEARIFFPDCRTAAETYGEIQAALLGVVCLLLALGWIKKAALI